MTLFGNRVLADVIIKIRSYWIRVDPKSNNRCPSRNRRVDTGKHLEGRRPCEDEGRDWGDAAVSQGLPRVSESHQTLDETRKDASLELLGEHSPPDTLILDFWPPKCGEL